MKNVITIFLFLFLCSFIHTGLAGADLIGPQRLENNANWTGGFYNGSRKGEIQWAVELEGEKCIRIIGQENGVVGYVMLKDFVPVESGRHLLFDYKGHSSIDNAHVQIRFYNQQRKEISKYVIKSKVTEGQWFILSKLKGQALFMGMDEEGSYQKGPRMSIANANSLPVPPYAAWARIFFLIDNISVLSLTDVVLRQKQLTAEEKDLREEQERLLLKFQEAVPRRPQERQAGFAISSEEIELPRVSKPLPDKWPVPKVEVRHGCFLLDGEPTYLTGAEAEATLTPFWYKLLGLDFVQHTTAYLINSAKISKNENGAHFTWTKPYADLSLGVRELLNHGLLPYVQMIEGSPEHLEKRLKLKEQAPDLMVDFGHFYGLRHDNEDAWAIRKNYFKNNLSALTDYPIFAIETFNEVMFIDGGAKAIERFRRWCQKKYGNIAWLNQVWRSDFESFDKIEPPLVAGWTYSFTNLPRNISRMMWRDWGEFSSLNSQEAFRKTYDLVKKYRPDTMVTVQSTAAFFYDHIFCGVSAESKSKAEDIYGDEVGIRYTTMSPGKENPLKVSAMLRGVLWIDYLAHLLPEQAQLSEECAASTNYMDIGEELQVIKLHDDQWRFKADNENQGSEKNYADPDFADEDWEKIIVPGMWALQGHTEVEQGWYRREIMISPENMQKNLFLNGNELAAETEIYINGRLVHRKFNTKDLVSLKINQYLRLGRNVLALKLRDSYCDGGYFWGGIRGDISIDLLSQQKPPVNYGQLRSYFWERMLHGESGSVYSYAYVNEGWKRYMYYPANMEWKAFKAFPQIKLEFKNSRDIVPQKKLRLGAKIALCYPEETMRHHIAETFTDASKGPLGHDVLSWYSALISTGVPSAVIPNSHLKTEKLRKYKAIFMQGNERVPTGAMNNLRRYVEQGGILIMDAASLQREDEFDAPIEKAKFAGCKIGAAYSDMADIAGGELDLPMHSTVPRLRDKIVGWETHAEKATLLLADSLKRPVLLGNRVGRGWVYTLTANPNGRALNKIFAKLLAKHQQLPDVSFQADEEVPWVERYLLGDKGKYLLYLHNWGGGTFNGRISLNKPLAPGNYTVRNLETGEALLTNTPVREIMKNGIKATLSSQNPLVLLMENSAPRELERLSDEQHQWLDYIDREPLENIPSAKRVLIYSGGIVTYSRIKLLTATYLLEQNGFECVAGISTPMTREMEVYNGTLKNENLSSYGIIFIGGNRAAFKAGEIELLEQYVKDGGRLFFCGNWARSFWISNYHNNQLLKLYGADITNYNYIDPQNCDDGVELYPIFNTASNKRLVSHGMALLQVDDNWQITVPGTAHCTGANMVPLAVEKQIKRNFRAAAIATREYGKGKIVVCGDPSWLEGENLKKGDNQEIFLGLMQWLGE